MKKLRHCNDSHMIYEWDILFKMFVYAYDKIFYVRTRSWLEILTQDETF